jgi:hypothetical protein
MCVVVGWGWVHDVLPKACCCPSVKCDVWLHPASCTGEATTTHNQQWSLRPTRVLAFTCFAAGQRYPPPPKGHLFLPHTFDHPSGINSLTCMRTPPADTHTGGYSRFLNTLQHCLTAPPLCLTSPQVPSCPEPPTPISLRQPPSTTRHPAATAAAAVAAAAVAAAMQPWQQAAHPSTAAAATAVRP